MNILDNIVAHKKTEVALHRQKFPIDVLESSMYFGRTVFSLSEALRKAAGPGIIAEFKRRSPSAGEIREGASVQEITTGYVHAGAAALSILTDKQFFGGSNGDLSEARHFNTCPVLRKDFVIDEYQIIEAKAIGADAILLIAACLSVAGCRELARFARSLGLEVLLELHDAAELSHVNEFVNAVGVNNRNLKTFEVSLAASFDIAERLPAEMLKVTESGLKDPAAAADLLHAGYKGFLIGEHFMRQPDPGAACRAFIEGINERKQFLDGAIA